VSFVFSTFPSRVLIRYSLDVIETRHRTLEETAAIFDGEEATENLAAIASQKINEPNKNLDNFMHEKSETSQDKASV
jgi:hypothetical protein